MGIIQRMALNFKWNRTKDEALKNFKRPIEIYNKRKDLYKDYLIADAKEENTKASDLISQIKAIDWVMGKVVIILLLLCTTAYAADSRVIIQDPDVTGRKAQVTKAGSNAALSTIMHSKKFMLCNRDDDATPLYYGFEAADGSWYIMKWTVSAGADVFAYDSGSSAYAVAWAARADVGTTYQSWGDEM